MELGPARAHLCLTVMLYLPALRDGPLGQTATSFSNEHRLKVNGSVGSMGELFTRDKPLHHGTKTCSDLEDLQRLLCGGARQGSQQALPDRLIQRAVVDALFSSEIAREAIGVGNGHATALCGKRPRPDRVPTYAP